MDEIIQLEFELAYYSDAVCMLATTPQGITPKLTKISRNRIKAVFIGLVKVSVNEYFFATWHFGTAFSLKQVSPGQMRSEFVSHSNLILYFYFWYDLFFPVVKRQTQSISILNLKGKERQYKIELTKKWKRKENVSI